MTASGDYWFKGIIDLNDLRKSNIVLKCDNQRILLPAPVKMHYVIKELRGKINLLYRVKFLTESIPIEMLGSEKKTQVNFEDL